MIFSGVFPGQGSQSVGMFAEFAVAYPQIKTVFEEASSKLGYDLWQLVQDGPAERLNLTQYTQPAMLAVGVAAWQVWKSAGGADPVALAGHSLGEYSALVAAGAITLADAAELVSLRGQYMQNAVPEGVGAIAALVGLDAAQVQALCGDCAQGEVLEAVNFNSQNQIVIAGHVGAIQRAMTAAEQAGAKLVVRLPVSVPVHSSLMTDAAQQFAAKVDELPMSLPAIPVIQNLAAQAYHTIDEIKNALRKHVNSPVLWMDSVLAMQAAGSTAFVEFGPGKVLAGLCKRIDRSLGAFAVDSPAGLDKALLGVSSHE